MCDPWNSVDNQTSANVNEYVIAAYLSPYPSSWLVDSTSFGVGQAFIEIALTTSVGLVAKTINYQQDCFSLGSIDRGYGATSDVLFRITSLNQRIHGRGFEITRLTATLLYHVLFLTRPGRSLFLG